MAKFEFKKDKNRQKKQVNIEKTEISKPKNEFNLEEFKSKVNDQSNQLENKTVRKVGRPAQNKEYTSLRIQKSTSFKVNALVNVLELDSVDELIQNLIEDKISKLSSSDETMFNMYVKTYENRNKRKKDNK